MPHKTHNTVTIWPITDAMFAKDLANAFKDRFRQLGHENLHSTRSKNGSRIKGHSHGEDAILIEISMHRIRLTEKGKKHRYLTVHLPDEMDLSDTAAILGTEAAKLAERNPNFDTSGIHVAVQTHAVRIVKGPLGI